MAARTNHGNDPVTGVDGGGPNSCNLYYQDPNLSASAAESLDLTLIGQQDVQPLTPDEVIVVKVPTSALKDSLVYMNTWTGPVSTTTSGVEGVDKVNGSEQDYPYVIFRPKVLVDNAVVANSSTALGRFLILDPDAKAQYEFEDDSGDNSLWTLQSYFANTPFVFTNPLLAQIPAESVKSVAVTKISTLPLTAGANAVQGATNFTAAGGNPIIPDYIVGITGAGTAPAANDYALDLFQQADAAGKVAYWQVSTGASGTSGSTTASPVASEIGLKGLTSSYSQVSFVEGDSITIYVTYNMTKTKTFHLDAPSTMGGPGTAQFKLTAADGSVISVADGVSMESQPASVVVAYQFMATPSAAPSLYQYGFNFAESVGTFDANGNLTMIQMAWEPVPGAQSYKLFFSRSKDILLPTNASGEPNALIHEYSTPGPFFYASTSAIAVNHYTATSPEFFNSGRSSNVVNVFVYAYSDEAASVRITQSVPLTSMYFGYAGNGMCEVSVWDTTYSDGQNFFLLKDGAVIDGDQRPLLIKTV
jgi:hypothetical protein